MESKSPPIANLRAPPNRVMSERGSMPRRSRTSSFSPPSPSFFLFSLAKFSLFRMARRSFLAKSLAAILAILSLYALFHSIPFPSPPPPPASFASRATAGAGAGAKIYLYDIPSKFTFGVIRSYLLARGGGDRSTSLASDANLRYPGHQHSAEWWLFSDLLRTKRNAGSAIVVVSDPSQADLFYVPFFSSLSLIVNPIRPTDESAPGSYSDEQMQEELVEWLERQEYWRRNNGRDHVIICQDPNALYKVIDRIRNAVLLVSDFGRLRGDQASLMKDVVLPYSHRINPYKGEVGVEGRPSLLFFMGNRYRKEV